MKEITEIEDWLKLIETEKIIVVEIYSSWFGYCEVYTPVIDKIMKEVCKKESEQQKIVWRRMNVAQLELELNENMKEKSDDENIKNRSLLPSSNNDNDTNDDDEENKNNDNCDSSSNANTINIESEAKTQRKTPLKTVALLEKWSAYENAQPLFVFIQGKEILDVLKECNQGKLKEIVVKCLQGIAKKMDVSSIEDDLNRNKDIDDIIINKNDISSETKLETNVKNITETKTNDVEIEQN